MSSSATPAGLPGDADRAEAGHRLGATGHLARTARLDHRARPSTGPERSGRRPARSARTPARWRPRPRSAPATARSPPGRTPPSAPAARLRLRRPIRDDVQRDHAGGGGQGGKDDAEYQKLLAHGDETGLGRLHRLALQCEGKSHTGSNFHTRNRRALESLSNYKRVISSRHADGSEDLSRPGGQAASASERGRLSVSLDIRAELLVGFELFVTVRLVLGLVVVVVEVLDALVDVAVEDQPALLQDQDPGAHLAPSRRRG